MTRPVAVVTGASSGIGAACAHRLADAGFEVVLGARRVDRIEAIAEETNGRAIQLDVTDPTSVDAFVAQVESCEVLVNNAGGAFGKDSIESGSDEDWLRMYAVNVLGVKRMTQSLLPKLRDSGNGRVVVISSIAATQPYPGGAGYNAAKHAVNAVTQVLRMEVLGTPVRVIDIAPGAVETEFSMVRFGGDQAKANEVYAAMTPLVADDVADCVVFAVTRPDHVNISSLVVMPRDQATAMMIRRNSD